MDRKEFSRCLDRLAVSGDMTGAERFLLSARKSAEEDDVRGGGSLSCSEIARLSAWGEGGVLPGKVGLTMLGETAQWGKSD